MPYKKKKKYLWTVFCPLPGFHLSLSQLKSYHIGQWPNVCFLAFSHQLWPVVTQLSFQSHQILFSHASAEVKGENTPERKFASTGSGTHDHQVMSLTRSPLKTLSEKEKMLVTSIFSFTHNIFYPLKNKFQFWSHIYFVVCKFFQFGLV